jgi:hypothetical protein
MASRLDYLQNLYWHAQCGDRIVSVREGWIKARTLLQLKCGRPWGQRHGAGERRRARVWLGGNPRGDRDAWGRARRLQSNGADRGSRVGPLSERRDCSTSAWTSASGGRTNDASGCSGSASLAPPNYRSPPVRRSRPRLARPTWSMHQRARCPPPLPLKEARYALRSSISRCHRTATRLGDRLAARHIFPLSD